MDSVGDGFVDGEDVAHGQILSLHGQLLGLWIQLARLTDI